MQITRTICLICRKELNAEGVCSDNECSTHHVTVPPVENEEEDTDPCVGVSEAASPEERPKRYATLPAARSSLPSASKSGAFRLLPIGFSMRTPPVPQDLKEDGEGPPPTTKKEGRPRDTEISAPCFTDPPIADTEQPSAPVGDTIPVPLQSDFVPKDAQAENDTEEQRNGTDHS